MNNRTDPILYIVIPCYNEQEVLPITAPMFLQKLADLTAAGKICLLYTSPSPRD